MTVDNLQELGQWRAVSSFSFLAVLLTWESLRPFFDYFVGNAAERIRHGLKNAILGVLNSALTGLGFVTLWWATAEWAQSRGFGLLNWISPPPWARLAATFLLFDAWMYWWHRLNHTLPFLWRFHRTHHSDPRMDVTTANRFHIGEIAISAMLRMPVIALIGLQLWELAIYELSMFAVVQLHHANVGVPERLDRWLRAIVVSPLMHKVHHSRWQPETDSNYSSLFSIWDRLFRSFRLPADLRTLRFGLEQFDRPEDHTLLGLLATPLRSRRERNGKS